MHSHILPAVDDGAQSLDEAIELIKAEILQGVHTIVLTPHFNPDMQDYEQYYTKIQAAYSNLCEQVDLIGLDVNLILGYEVKFSPKILDLDLNRLCIGNTRYILIEFSIRHTPTFAKEVFYSLMQRDYIPIIAHAERYNYFTKRDSILADLIATGALVQINTDSLDKKSKSRKQSLWLIKHQSAHLLGTDTHSLAKRPPKMDAAVEVINKKFGYEKVNAFKQNSINIIADEVLLN